MILTDIEIGIRLAEGIRVSELLEYWKNCDAWLGQKTVKIQRQSVTQWQNSSSVYYQWPPEVKYP